MFIQHSWANCNTIAWTLLLVLLACPSQPLRIPWLSCALKKLGNHSTSFREGSGNELQYSCLENLVWRSLVGCSPWGRWKSDTTERLHFHFSLSCIGEGNGNPLQRSCLENPRVGRAWWAAVYGVAQSRTRLKRLSSYSSSSAGWEVVLPSQGADK